MVLGTLLIDIKHFFGEAETNIIQNNHACDIDSGVRSLAHYRSCNHDNFDTVQGRIQTSVLVSDKPPKALEKIILFGPGLKH